MGANNTATGRNALANNSTGNNNIALGASAGSNLTTGSNNVDINNRGMTGESNTIPIGTTEIQTTTLIAGISGATVPTAVAVIVGANGHLGTTTSSARFKQEIKPMDDASEAILTLKPVTFRYKHELDPEGVPQFGLVAEDVQKVNPDLVARDEQGKPYTVRYDAVNAMLLNEFIKEHRTMQGQQKEIDALKAQLKEQRSLIQKVSAALEVSKAAPQTVQNNY
jgi:predicted ribosome quality control (RQC) complex YloA/Tae2 family protein